MKTFLESSPSQNDQGKSVADTIQEWAGGEESKSEKKKGGGNGKSSNEIDEKKKKNVSFKSSLVNEIWKDKRCTEFCSLKRKWEEMKKETEDFVMVKKKDFDLIRKKAKLFDESRAGMSEGMDKLIGMLK